MQALHAEHLEMLQYTVLLRTKRLQLALRNQLKAQVRARLAPHLLRATAQQAMAAVRAYKARGAGGCGGGSGGGYAVGGRVGGGSFGSGVGRNTCLGNDAPGDPGGGSTAVQRLTGSPLEYVPVGLGPLRPLGNPLLHNGPHSRSRSRSMGLLPRLPMLAATASLPVPEASGRPTVAPATSVQSGDSLIMDFDLGAPGVANGPPSSHNQSRPSVLTGPRGVSTASVAAALPPMEQIVARVRSAVSRVNAAHTQLATIATARSMQGGLSASAALRQSAPQHGSSGSGAVLRQPQHSTLSKAGRPHASSPLGAAPLDKSLE